MKELYIFHHDGLLVHRGAHYPVPCGCHDRKNLLSPRLHPLCLNLYKLCTTASQHFAKQQPVILWTWVALQIYQPVYLRIKNYNDSTPFSSKRSPTCIPFLNKIRVCVRINIPSQDEQPHEQIRCTSEPEPQASVGCQTPGHPRAVGPPAHSLLCNTISNLRRYVDQSEFFGESWRTPLSVVSIHTIQKEIPNYQVITH